MLLKLIYDADDLARYHDERISAIATASDKGTTLADALTLGEKLTRPPGIKYAEVRHTGVRAAQNFSTRLVAQGVADGWITIDGDTLTLRADPEDLVYTIVARPGFYCCHDGKAFADRDGALLYTQTYFGAEESPDQNHPHGWGRRNHYECVLDARQHAKFRAVPGALAPSMHHVKD